MERSYATRPRGGAAPRRVGIGWRPELASGLLARPDAVDFVEVTAEACVASAGLREASAVAEAWPVVVHGVKTSLGGADGFDRDRAATLGRVARALRAECVSEHVAFVRAGDVEIGHLTSLPFTAGAVAVVADNVVGARRLLPDVPLLLENVAWAFRWPDDAIDEGDFHREVVEKAGCDLLLDVGNLYANALNAGRDPLELLSRYPLDRVAMVHVAGGVWDDGLYLDTHAHPIPDAVFDIVARVLEVAGDVPVVLERDADFPPFVETASELARLGSRPRSPSRRAGRPATPPRAVPLESRARAALADAQRAVASALTASVAPVGPWLAPARAILQRKRVDDALPLLPTVSAHGKAAVDVAVRCLDGAPRPRAMVAVQDAIAIAKAAEEHAALRDAARVDGLVLRARFVVKGPSVEPRSGPFIARVEAGPRSRRWVVKGPGAEAKVRIIERSRVA